MNIRIRVSAGASLKSGARLQRNGTEGFSPFLPPREISFREGTETVGLFIRLRRLFCLTGSARAGMRTGRTAAVTARRFALFFTDNRAYDHRRHDGDRRNYDDDFDGFHDLLPIEECRVQEKFFPTE